MVATHGVPKDFEIDNGTRNAAQEFKKFSKKRGLEHVTSKTQMALPSESCRLLKEYSKTAPMLKGL